MFRYDLKYFTRSVGMPRSQVPVLNQIFTFARLCSVGHVQNHTRGIFPGITRAGTYVSSVRRLYPYPDVL